MMMCFGELAEIPELVLSTIDLSAKAIYNISKTEKWFDIPTQDVTKL